ncbi:transcriptional regulator FnrL [Palleronia caenipelagi]|uniref:Crp/Fnr family transcriptional regulator n=1 Tax=Palleronia caenipelagi TaxID=2489174 RepID=A0A547PT96_9RHOB|nr:Crp/Fnr family transcriptional regulator [Palleronia caenipelagi]TRD17372.1 Crp/Fnr family transcriptional regulator [Palleronia caenipelagi]
MFHRSSTVSCGTCPIRKRAVCAECSSDELDMLEQAKSYRTYPAGTTIVGAGEMLTHFSSIVIGCATLSRTLEDGRRQNVGLLLPSDYIGRPGRSRSAFDVVALSDTVLCRFERTEFEKICRTTPHIASRLLTMTLDELDAARDWTVVLGRMTAREKVASFLVNLARRQSRVDMAPLPENGVTVRLPLSREEMANHLGLTIETTSRQITALRKSGLIDTQGSRYIRIPDFEALAIEAGDDEDGGLIV